ncbi:hypothetical protein B0T17DRAFT_593100 [Bombardia bombarda]|uniref:Uncharacterized protein n=1 Tax=Bombardia bombarda TaxID=252184 RepID=A0AA39U7L2_9PEZI|nr:hypothetical protein B0T17DRAFT_593100 [Bombardia bombarda]
MPSFGHTYASSPVLAMQPQPIHHYPVPYQYSIPSYLHRQTPSSFSQAFPWRQQFLVRSCSVAGRKRSRDEASVNLDSPEKVVEPPAIKEPEEEWEYGPGMTLIKKSSGYVTDAASQSGTWVEEKKAEIDARKAEAALLVQEQLSQDRPSLRSHKSQRLESSSNVSDTRPLSRRSSPIRENSMSSNPLTASSDSISQPIVDDFTFHLGIGWSRISDHIEAAARGWARYIENHYPVTNARILLESRGLQSYLVESTEGYFLFAENLRQGRLVSTTPERALQNLKSSPPIFDGCQTMEATETSKPTDVSLPDLASTGPLASSVAMDMS